MKNLLTGLSLSVITLALMLGVSEAIIRQFLDPIDYLKPTLVPDAELGHRIAPYSSGHDAWGFRNKSVPNQAQIVLIGDSQIYGTASTSESSIASLLQKQSGSTVYNMALGGYGAAQYSILLDRAFELSPEMVLLGIYFGNDFMDAFNYVYHRDHARFSSLRAAQFHVPDTAAPVVIDPAPGKRFEAARDFLARHSVLYRVATSQMDFVRTQEQRRSGKQILEITSRKGDRLIGIALARARQVDTSDPRVEEGVRLTLHFIDDMKRRCDARGIRLGVMLIPTEFTAFESEIVPMPGIPDEARKAIENEKALFDRFQSVLGSWNVVIVDVRKPIQDAIRRGERVYPVNDGHPTNRGNQIIAAFTSERLAMERAGSPR